MTDNDLKDKCIAETKAVNGKCNRFKATDMEYPDYCKGHQKIGYYVEKTEDGKIICSNFHRTKKCTNIVTNTEYATCQECRDDDKIACKKRRDKKKADLIVDENGKQCTICFVYQLLINFLHVIFGTITNTCISCRMANKQVIRKKKRSYIMTEEQKKRHKKTKNARNLKNPKKSSEYSKKYREKKSLEMGDVKYKKMLAFQARLYRKNNPEIMKKIYDNKKKNRTAKYKIYVWSAKQKNLSFELSEEQCIDFFNDECFYCRFPGIDYPNGIDRLDSSDGYNMDNCVSCCETCNMSKGQLSPLLFLDRIEHILYYNKLINDDYDEEEEYMDFELFSDYKSDMSYEAYMSDSINNRNIPFELSEDTYLMLKKGKCYICGKKKTDTHCNGIDRVDNDIGYTDNNSKTCCANCNFMKKDIDYFDFLNHITKIYFNNKYYNDKNNKIQIEIENKNISRCISEKEKAYDLFMDKFDDSDEKKTSDTYLICLNMEHKVYDLMMKRNLIIMNNMTKNKNSMKYTKNKIEILVLNEKKNLSDDEKERLSLLINENNTIDKNIKEKNEKLQKIKKYIYDLEYSVTKYMGNN